MDRKRAFARLFYLALLAAAAWFVATRWESVAAQLRRLSGGTLALLVLTTLLSIWLTALRVRIQIGIFRIRLRFREWFGLTVCNAMLNYLPGRGGTAMLAVYLKQRHDFSYARLFLLAAVSYLLFFGLSAAFSALLLAGLALGGEPWYGRLFWPLLGCVALALAGFAGVRIVHRFHLHTPVARLNELLRHLADGMTCFRGNGAALAQLGALYLASLGVIAVRYWLIFRALGADVSLLKLAVIQAVAEYSTLIAVTPGNLGVKEGLSVFTATLLAIPAASMMVAALIDRAVNMAAVFALGPVFTHLLLGRSAAPAPGSPR